MVKPLGEDACRMLYDGNNYYATHMHVSYTVARLISVWKKFKTVRINSLKAWFRQFEIGKARQIVGLAPSGDIQSKQVLELWLAILESTRDLWQVPLPCKIYAPSLISKPGVEEGLGLVDIPWIPQEAQEMAYNCIHAPWVDVFKKGVVEDAYDYDLNSAYPYEIYQLPTLDYMGGNWENSTEYDPFAMYGFCQALITVYENVHASPIKLRFEGRIYSPYGSWIGYITKDEIDYLHKHKLGKVEVLNGWWFRAGTRIYPFKKGAAAYIHGRDKARMEGDTPRAYALKMAAASVYGRFLQKKQDLEGDWFTSGTFCPVYACIVMTRVKMRLAEYALLLGEDVISVNVDGLVSETELAREHVSDPNDIGGLKLAHVGKLLSVAPLMYSVSGRDSVLDWFALAEASLDEDAIDIGGPRRVGLCEALYSGEFELLASANRIESRLLVRAEHGRSWDKTPIKVRQLLTDSYSSRMLHVEEIVWRALAVDKLNNEKLMDDLTEILNESVGGSM